MPGSIVAVDDRFTAVADTMLGAVPVVVVAPMEVGVKVFTALAAGRRFRE
jgi:hypothetical protein